MIVSDLIAQLQTMNGDDEVVVKVKKSSPSIGPSHAVSVEDITGGFDWNRGRVFLGTNETVYAGLEKLEAAAKFARLVRNALYLRKKSKNFDQKDAVVIRAIERALDKWLPNRLAEERSDPA